MAQSDIYNALATTDLSKRSAESLFVPTYKTFIEHHHLDNAPKRVDNSREICLRQDEALKAWRYVSGAPTLTSKSLIPIGILIMLYNRVFPSTHATSTVADHPLSHLIHQHDPSCDIDRPSDLVPLAAALGHDVFENAVSNS